MKKIVVACAVALTLAGCTYREQRAATGAGIGAVAGAVIGGAATGRAGGAVVGGLIGAASGAVIADATRPSYRCRVWSPRRGRYITTWCR
jgi:osmotically inducible lipoprotein OsmB